MKKLKPWQYIAIGGLLLVFGLRVWFALEKKKDREEQVRMIRDLSIQQVYSDSTDIMDVITNPGLMESLDSAKQALDSIGMELRKQQERFKEQFNISDENE